MNAQDNALKPGGIMERRWSRKKRAGRDAAERSEAEAARPAAGSGPKDPAAKLRREALDLLQDTKPKTAENKLPDISDAVTRDPEHPSDAEHEIGAYAAPAESPETRPTPEPVSAPTGIPAAGRERQDSREPGQTWQRVPRFELDVKHLEKNRIITAERSDPAHSAFDVLRTKLLRMLHENGWSRVAITSPTEGCGKTFMSVNLALSLSRQANCRTVLMDLDMRRPSVAKVLGLRDPGSMGDFLRGDLAMEELFRRAAPNDLKVGDNIAVAANGRREDYASELMQLPETAEAMDRMEEALSPDVILFDMPPALVNDDVLAARPLFDGVLLIIGGGITKPQQVRDVERRLGTETPLLGVVLNRSEGEGAQSYSY